jgi:hypothetical protein
MWTTVVTGLLGAISGFVSPLIKGWEDRKNAEIQLKIEKERHCMEIEKLDKETELQVKLGEIQLEQQRESSLQAKYLADINLEGIKVKSEEEMTKSNDALRIEAYKTFFSGDQKIDRIIALARPTITALFTSFFLGITTFLIIKGIKVSNIRNINDLNEFCKITPLVALTDLTAGIVNFWFASRVMTKGKK